MLVRTWNLFHGNSHPPRRRAFLREMVQMVTQDDPDVVCLQEVPVWAVRLLEHWSGMQRVSAVARRPRIPFGRWPTELNHGLLRSAFTGQANAVLVCRAYAVVEHRRLVLNPFRFRRAQARRLGLGRSGQRAWGRERRVCEAVRIRRLAQISLDQPELGVAGRLVGERIEESGEGLH